MASIKSKAASGVLAVVGASCEWHAPVSLVLQPLAAVALARSERCHPLTVPFVPLPGAIVLVPTRTEVSTLAVSLIAQGIPLYVRWG